MAWISPFFVDLYEITGVIKRDQQNQHRDLLLIQGILAFKIGC